MKRRRPLEFLENPTHYPRRERPHVAQEYFENQQDEIAESLAFKLTPKAREALGF